jgi:DNA-binding NarL/FixJ family response regulator
VRSEPPRLAILDVALPGICGYQLCSDLRSLFGQTVPIIFVSGERTEPFDRVAGLLLGADEYLVKPFALDELLIRVRRLITRMPSVAPAVMSKLTARESEVLHLLAAGRMPDEIAKELVISVKTVRTHMEHVFGKLGVHSQAQAVAAAYGGELMERRWSGSR